MTLEEAQQIVRDALAPLCTPLHEGIAEAAEDANLVFGEHGMMDKIYNPGRHHLARCLAHRRLSRRARRDLGGWKVVDKGPNVALMLSREAMRLKILKPLLGDQIPPPGRNRARIAYYSNHRNGLMPATASDYLGLWDIDADEELAIRIVRPIGEWRFGSTAKVDLDFYLPLEAEEFESLSFEPFADLDVELPFETSEGEEGDAGDQDG